MLRIFKTFVQDHQDLFSVAVNKSRKGFFCNMKLLGNTMRNNPYHLVFVLFKNIIWRTFLKFHCRSNRGYITCFRSQVNPNDSILKLQNPAGFFDTYKIILLTYLQREGNGKKIAIEMCVLLQRKRTTVLEQTNGPANRNTDCKASSRLAAYSVVCFLIINNKVGGVVLPFS